MKAALYLTLMCIVGNVDVNAFHSGFSRIRKQSYSKIEATTPGTVKENREGDLTKAGFKVVKKSPRESLDEKLQDPELIAKLIGSMTDADEIEVLNMLKQTISESSTTDTAGLDVGGGLDPSLFAEIQADAKETLDALRSKPSDLAALLDSEDNDEDGSSDADPSFAAVSDISRVLAADDSSTPASGVDRLISSLVANGSGDLVDAIGPPLSAPGTFFEIEEAADEDEGEGVESGIEATEVDASEQQLLAIAEDEVPKLASVSSNRQSRGVSSELPIAPKQQSEPLPLPLPLLEGSSKQEAFAQLLKVTMDQQSQTTSDDLSSDVVRSTVDAASEGNMAGLDVKSLLGEALSSLTEQLGIDVTAEIAGSDKTQADIQRIMAANMAELAANMEELDKQSAELYQQLGALESSLRAETAQFEDQKQLELEDLLFSQNQLQGEFEKSKAKVDVSTAKLEGLMKDLEDNADPLTALALLPVKSIDKKIAFVLGLALVLKVPFDVTQLWAVRSTDFSDWLGILTQSGLCLALMNHYGMIRALLNGKNGTNLPTAEL